MAVLLIIGLTACGGGNTETEETEEVVTEEEETSTPSDTDSSKSAEELKVGETFKSGDVDITLDSLTTSPGDDIDNPGEGNEYLIANWTIKNNSDEDYDIDVLVNAYVDGKTVDESFISGIAEPIDLGATLIGDTETQGSSAFIVPTDFSEVKFRVTDNGNSATYTVTPENITQ